MVILHLEEEVCIFYSIDLTSCCICELASFNLATCPDRFRYRCEGSWV